MSKKKEDKAAAAAEMEQKMDLPINRLIFDCTKDKYRLVTLAIRWAVEVKNRAQTNDTPQELVDKALKEILTGQVDPADIEKLPPVPKVDKKAMDIAKAAADKLEKLEIDEKKG